MGTQRRTVDGRIRFPASSGIGCAIVIALFVAPAPGQDGVRLGQPVNHAADVVPAKDKDSKDPPADKSSKIAHKIVSLEMRNMPWGRVFEWLTDQTGLPVISTHKPTGSVNIITPGKYTLVQAIDLLNEALLTQKFILIRREASFTVVPATRRSIRSWCRASISTNSPTAARRRSCPSCSPCSRWWPSRSPPKSRS
jgi:hypothetical protein